MCCCFMCELLNCMNFLLILFYVVQDCSGAGGRGPRLIPLLNPLNNPGPELAAKNRHPLSTLVPLLNPLNNPAPLHCPAPP